MFNQMSRGFTLLEVLLSVAIISVITGLSLPVLTSFNNRNDLDITTQRVVSQFRRAQTYSRGVNGDSQWGVHIQAGSAILYKGATYAGRDTAYDEETIIPATFSITGISDVVYSKLAGAPSQTGSITLTNTISNEARTITINAKGMVSY